jgi:hypothetical protein
MTIVRLASGPPEAARDGVRPTAAVASSKSAQAGETVATRPAAPYVIFSILALAGGFIGGIILQNLFHPGMTKLPVIPAGVGVFALIYIVAQAIERVLEPFSWFGGGFLGDSGASTKSRLVTQSGLAKKRQNAMTQALNAPTNPDTAQNAADAQHAVEQYKANLTASTFGLAALLAMLVSGYTGLFLLATARVHVAGWLDLLVTGLAIAGGTKPLHDTISNLSSASQSKKSDIST